MDWNKEVKGPMAALVIIAGGILFGGVFCLVIYSKGERNVAHLSSAFVFGISTFIYISILMKLGKNPSPWLRRNLKLIVTIGGLLNAVLIIWSMLSKK